ncbi:MAG: hypothetical protein M0T70_04920 [Geobacteraceae bacterium]|nr:hypothetical protein [Geobacteraceae bacterium]
MKKLILVLLLAATVAQAKTYTPTGNVAVANVEESIREVPADILQIAAVMARETGKTSNRFMVASSAERQQTAVSKGAVTPSVDELTDRMMQDKEIMGLIAEIQKDPDMQALMSDPAILQAIQAGDYGTLMNNPVFMNLLNKPQVREIERKVQENGM